MSTPISGHDGGLNRRLTGLGAAQLAAVAALGAGWHPAHDFWLILGIYSVAFGLYAGACRQVLTGGRASLALVLGAALAFRLSLLGSAPMLSDDVYRYLWEGKVSLAGFNPLVQAPDHPTLTGLRDTLHGQVNHRAIPSVYPPLAQLVFAGLARWWASVTGAQLVFTAWDLGTIGALVALLRARRQPLARVLLYAWNPLPIIEFSQSAHMDPLGIAPMVGAVALLAAGRPALAALAAGLSATGKLLGGALWALTGRRAPGATALAAALFAVSWLPLYDPGMLNGLGTYAQHWRFNGGLFPLIEALTPEGWARPAAAALWAGAVVATARRGAPEAVAMVTAGGFFLLSPTAHPWYLCWALPWMALRPSAAWIGLSWLVFFSYSALTTLDPQTGAWQELGWVPWLEYGGFAALALWEWRRGSASPDGTSAPPG